MFWTIRLPDDAVNVLPGNSGAEMHASNIHVFDFGSLENAFGQPVGEGTASFRVRWAGGGQRVNVVNTSDGHAGEYIRNTAQMEWSVTTKDYDLVSDPIETSSSIFAQFGRERNGSFFDAED